MKYFSTFITSLLITAVALPQFSKVQVKLAGSNDPFETFNRPTTNNRLCLIRGQNYTIRFTGQNLWLLTFSKIEIAEGDFNQTFNKSDLLIQTVDGEDRITILNLSIPSSAKRGDFVIRLRYTPETNGPDNCHAKLIERGSFASAVFIGIQPIRVSNKVVLKPNLKYRLRLTGNNLDNANPFSLTQSLRENLGSGLGQSFTFSNVVRTATTLEMDLMHTRTAADINLNAKNLRITDKEATQNTPTICNYQYAANMPILNEPQAVATNMVDWVAGYGTSVLPDLVPVPFPTGTVYFRPKPFGLTLNATNGNVYMELVDGFGNLLTGLNSTTITVPGLGEAREYLLDLPDLNYGVRNMGAAAVSPYDIALRVFRYRSATDNSENFSMNTIKAVNFPGKDQTSLVLYVRPQVRVYTFATQSGKVFLKRDNATTVNPDEEFRFMINVSSVTTGGDREARTDNNSININ